MRIPDIMLVSAQFSMEYDERKADAIFVDETGGYGAGVVDDMRRRGYPVIGVQFGGKPNDYRYYDKRSEMLFELRSEEHTSELQSLMSKSYAVFCVKKKKNKQHSKQ